MTEEKTEVGFLSSIKKTSMEKMERAEKRTAQGGGKKRGRAKSRPAPAGSRFAFDPNWLEKPIDLKKSTMDMDALSPEDREDLEAAIQASALSIKKEARELVEKGAPGTECLFLPVELTPDGEIPDRMKDDPALVTCGMCGRIGMLSSGERSYCSDSCVEHRAKFGRRVRYLQHSERYRTKRSEPASAKKKELPEGEDRVCRNCGKTFHTTDKRRWFCSEQCTREGLGKRLKKYSTRRPQSSPPATLVCEVCGREYDGQVSRKKVCSVRCDKINRIRAMEREAMQIGYLPGSVIPSDSEHEHVCANCGTHFVSSKPIQEFCSEECEKTAPEKKVSAALKNASEELLQIQARQTIARRAGIIEELKYLRQESQNVFARMHPNIAYPRFSHQCHHSKKGFCSEYPVDAFAPGIDLEQVSMDELQEALHDSGERLKAMQHDTYRKYR